MYPTGLCIYLLPSDTKRLLVNVTIRSPKERVRVRQRQVKHSAVPRKRTNTQKKSAFHVDMDGIREQ